MKIYFTRTILLASHLNNDFLKIINEFKEPENKENLLILFKKHLESIAFDKYNSLIQEVLEIESKKYNLKNKMEEILKIKSLEKFLNWHREIILSLDFAELSNIKFIQNNLIHLSQSNWEIALDEYWNASIVLNNLSKPPKQHYFLFQQTGHYDSILETNVVEYKLSKYEYFLLQQFYKPKELIIVIKDFIDVFEVQSSVEYNALYSEIRHMLKIMIFNKLIIPQHNRIIQI